MENSDNKKFIRYTGFGIVSALLSNWLSVDYMLICTGVVSLIGGLHGANTLLREPASRFNFFQMAPVVIVLASSVGVLFSFIVLTLVSHDIWEITLEYTHTTTTDICLAQAYANAFSVSLVLAGRKLHRPEIIRQLYADIAVCLHDHKRVVRIWIAFILGCQSFLYYTGVIVYGGRDLGGEGEPTHPLLAVILPLAPSIPVALAYYLRKASIDRDWLNALPLVCLLGIDLFWFFLLGRRSIISFFIFAGAGFSFGMSLNANYLFRNSLTILFTGLVALTIADTYHKMRSVYGFADVQRLNIVNLLADLPTADDETYATIRTMNVAGRAAYSSLALGQFVNLFRTTSHAPLLGQVLTNSLLCATPSNLLVDKNTVPVKEALYERAFSLHLTDISETLYLESFVDFGWFGVLVYPLFLAGLLSGISAVIRTMQRPALSALTGCMFLSLAVAMVEIDMITFLAAVRTLIVCCGLSLVLRKRNRHSEPALAVRL